MKIAIVGGGHAARFHLMAYASLKYKINFEISVLVEPDEINAKKWFKLYKKLFHSESPTWYKNISEIPTLEDYIVDICSPNNTHLNFIKQCTWKRCKNYIVEKPAFTNSEELNDYKLMKGIKVFLQENYIYSPVLSTIKNLMATYGLSISTVEMNFSKNRTIDSANRRGFNSGVPPHVFMIEIPHTLSIAYYLLGYGKVISAESKDMIVHNERLLNHGEGLITLEHESAHSFHYSSLTQTCRERTIILKGKDKNGDNILIRGNFANSHDDLLGIIEFKIHDQTIEYIEVDDNSLALSLENILYAFKDNKDLDVNSDFIIKTSEILFDSINKTTNKLSV
ncbi:Gfo/Idh/MocA family protein [Bacillus infantis]|uniref:Gfo/Idh/MocA family protein n=1 Tax=Bacillus infantis TaxID=324767 RepID=UPI001653CDAA|nr:Gfo/Idh/MocA family oxidoreductase [Bacillus infantis]